MSMNYLNTGIPGLLRLKKSRGYLTVMFRVGERKVNFTVHRLVAAAFIGPRPSGLHINHVDGVKSNNAATNLAYVTPSENTLHSYRMGLQSQVGESHNQAKLTDEKVREIRRRVVSGESQASVARALGVSQPAVNLVAKRKRWAHVKDTNEIKVLQ